MRAREPDVVGAVCHDGVRVPYEVFGSGDPTVLLLPSWPIVDRRQWRFQVPHLARRYRTAVLETRGQGGADRPTDPAAYTDAAHVGDALAVLDELGVERAVVAGVSRGGRFALQLAARHPDRVQGAVIIAPAFPTVVPPDFETGSGMVSRRRWLADHAGFAEWYLRLMFPEAHSETAVADGLEWALQTTPEVLVATYTGIVEDCAVEATARSVRCPVLLVHGDRDGIVPLAVSEDLARWSGGELVVMEGSGHVPQLRDPVRFNGLLTGFLERFAPRPAPVVRRRGIGRPPRALVVTSSIGLGHAARDLAIVDELSALRPDLQVEWLAGEPVAAAFAARGECVHPGSRLLVSESAHVESLAGEHDLRAFDALRRMDDILLSHFHLLDDVLAADPVDLVVADEGWEVDRYLHENPELKRAPFAWLTDFVGWLPVTDADPDAVLIADRNAEMIDHVARHPTVRDRSVFVGERADLVDLPLGPGLPTVREWTTAHFAFPGYVAPPPVDRAEARAALGYAEGETVCLVTVGGTAVGLPLLRRVLAARPALVRAVPGLRLVLVTGPRIVLEPHPGVDLHGYLPDLRRHVAACDVALVQGGLTTTMELVAAHRPFVSVPLAGHFEQRIHVAHRLRRHGAGAQLEFTEADPDRIAEAVLTALRTPVDYLPVPRDGAARAAALLAELVGR
ncbi:alpha/beta hydrolase [Pseudonocardia xishanensis]|uniref:Pimeloyl-ACP methyl ester carboxylesterase n=1 Tax=Pseudonocardia xishanensis TaxID=630995 RepID=A0ABP8S5Q1_9PSEU